VLTVRGVAAANSKVEVFNGSAQLGTTTASASGAWSFTTPSLSNGTQSFKAKDVNSAGKISAPSTALNVNVVTDANLAKVGNNYNVTAAASDPVLKYKGYNVTAGEFGKWTPIGAVQTATGYYIAWKNTATGQYTMWSTDSNGNYTGNLIGAVSGNSNAWESIAPIFPQPLNTGGVTSPTTKVIQKDGSTQLTEVANRYFDLVSSSGSALPLKYKARSVTVGEFGKWTPIGAVQTTSGYDVAWKNTSTGQYTVWTTDGNGNYKANIGAVSGTSTALESLEPVFHQDLNHDGVIGLYAAPGKTLQISNALGGTSGSATIGTGATLELKAADSASVTFAGSTGTLRLDHSSTFSGKIFKFAGNGTLSGSDHIDLRNIKYSSVHDSYSKGVLTVTDGSGDSAKLNFSGSYSLANFKFANDGSGGTIVYDPPVTPSSGQSPAAPKPGAALAATQTALDPVPLPDIAFNVQSTLGHLPDSNQPGAIQPLAQGIQSASTALLGNYMASFFAAASDYHGSASSAIAMTQPNDQSMLSNPHHA
jgi:hypothetical protein